MLSSIVISLYSFKRCEKLSFELHANTCAGSVLVMCVLFLISLLRLISTSRSKCFKKSAPIICESTSAIVNGHVNDWLRPMSRVRFFVPYVPIELPFAAKSFLAGIGFILSLADGGMTEISAPVSIRNLLLVLLSFT